MRQYTQRTLTHTLSVPGTVHFFPYNEFACMNNIDPIITSSCSWAMAEIPEVILERERDIEQQMLVAYMSLFVVPDTLLDTWRNNMRPTVV